ncbi:unnamed protein product [Protopolystoma xenopodis]|uniref:Uncharacterized protein n=1 Tax=Protopolystoma xenopodis TaxID=117903 RepID=A0A448WU29_9PLAT|nr:unnamed protein product [Protopolystoma xenopodis]
MAHILLPVVGPMLVTRLLNTPSTSLISETFPDLLEMTCAGEEDVRAAAAAALLPLTSLGRLHWQLLFSSANQASSIDTTSTADKSICSVIPKSCSSSIRHQTSNAATSSPSFSDSGSFSDGMVTQKVQSSEVSHLDSDHLKSVCSSPSQPHSKLDSCLRDIPVCLPTSFDSFIDNLWYLLETAAKDALVEREHFASHTLLQSKLTTKSALAPRDPSILNFANNSKDTFISPNVSTGYASEQVGVGDSTNVGLFVPGLSSIVEPILSLVTALMGHQISDAESELRDGS